MYAMVQTMEMLKALDEYARGRLGAEYGVEIHGDGKIKRYHLIGTDFYTPDAQAMASHIDIEFLKHMFEIK